MSKRWKKALGAGAVGAAAAYGAYAVGAGVFSYLRPPKVSAENRKQLDAVRFRGDSEGPDRAYLIETPQQAFSRRLEVIRAAQCSIDMALYTTKSGATPQVIFAEILRAADRGVRVRILLSARSGAFKLYPAVGQALYDHPQVSVRIFSPTNPLLPHKWNVMMHDKFLIVDRRRLTLGGRNLGDEYFDPPRYHGKVTRDREVGILRMPGVPGDSVLPEAQAYFELLWRHKEAQPYRPPWYQKRVHEPRASLLKWAARWQVAHAAYCSPGPPAETIAVPTRRVRLIHNPVSAFKKEPWVGYQMRRIAHNADTVLLQTPYATNNPEILGALQGAVQRAQQAEMLTNSPISTPNLPAYSVYYTTRPQFLRTGVDIWEYQSHDSIHGKSMLADKRISVVGSFNMDDRSLYIDTETMLVIDSEAFYEVLYGAIHTLQQQAAHLGADNHYDDAGARPLYASLSKRWVLWRASVMFRPVRFLV